jgi:hypothetical protein
VPLGGGGVRTADRGVEEEEVAVRTAGQRARRPRASEVRVWVVWLGLLFAPLARAEPRIVVVETRGAPPLPALVSQVATHVGDRASVHVRGEPDADPLTYAARASQLVASGEATVVVWVAPADRGFLVFASAGWPGRAVIELIRVDAELGAAELERTVGLKLAGLLDAVLAPAATLREALGPAAPPPAWRLEIGGALARESRSRGLDGRVALAASRASRHDAWRVAPLLAGYWQPTGAIEGLRGRASITEVGAVLALEAARELPRTQLFLRPRATAALLDARGASNDGRRGAARVVVPHLGAEAGARRAVSEHLWLGLAIGCDVALIHRELVVDEETIVDVGLVRLGVGVSLTVSL